MGKEASSWFETFPLSLFPIFFLFCTFTFLSVCGLFRSFFIEETFFVPLTKKADRKHFQELSLRLVNNSLVTDGFGRFFSNDGDGERLELAVEAIRK